MKLLRWGQRRFFINFDDFDMKLRENNEADVKIESMVMQYSEVVQRYRVTYIHSECLNELLNLRSH